MIFALKRSLRSRSLWLLLALCCAATLLAAFAGLSGERPAAGVWDMSQSPESQRVVSFLEDNGFLRVESAEAGVALVEQGQLDCLVVLPEDLTQRLLSGQLEGAVRFVSSPTSLTPGLYRNLTAAALFSEYVPYITAGAFEDTPVSRQAVLEQYAQWFEGGYAFSFDVVSDHRAPIPETVRGQALLKAVVSGLLMTVCLLTAGAAYGEFRAFCPRIGLNRALRTVLLPTLALRSGLCAGSICLGLGVGYWTTGEACFPELMPCVWVGAILLSAFGLLLWVFLPGRQAVYVLLPVLLIAFLALCPVYTDLSLVLPAVAYVRWLLPAWWVWLAAQQPWLWLAISLGLLLASLGAVYLRGAWIDKNTIKRVRFS